MALKAISVRVVDLLKAKTDRPAFFYFQVNPIGANGQTDRPFLVVDSALKPEPSLNPGILLQPLRCPIPLDGPIRVKPEVRSSRAP